MNSYFTLDNKLRRLVVFFLVFLATVAAMLWTAGSDWHPSRSALELDRAVTAEGDADHSHTSPSHLEKRDETLSSSEAAGRAAYGNLPMSFEANEGQSDARVKFASRGRGYGLFLTSAGAVLSLNETSNPQLDRRTGFTSEPSAAERRAVVSMILKGARSSARITGFGELPGKVSYFIGNDPHKWHKGIPTFAKVRYQNAYPGIDVEYYGNQQQLEYDFVIAPGADPNCIKLAFKGVERIFSDANDDLILGASAGDVRQRKPVAYQQLNGQRREVDVHYRIEGSDVSFKVERYDRSQRLIIDPVLIYSSFLGGISSEDGLGIAVDAQGSAYLTGSTASTDFPLSNAFQSAKDAFTDAFVVKLNPAGTAFVYSTYFGGNGSDTGNAIAVDAQGSAYVVGFTGSGSFPTTPGAFQTSKDGLIDGFLTKLSPSGSSLIYSTLLGGDNNDTAYGVAVDSSGRAYVVGRTDSTRFGFLPIQRNGSPAYKSTDAADHWSASAAELTGSAVNAFALDPGDSNVLYAGSNVGVFKSTTAGAHWNLTGTVRPGTAPLFTNAVVVDPSNTAIVYAGTSSGVYKSTDGGALYDVKNSGLLIPSVNSLAIDPVTPTTLYAGTLFGIYKSTNGGDTWVEVKNGITGGSPRVLKVVVDPTNSATVYMGTNRGMFKTTNGGALWTVINGGALSSGFTPQITALAIDPLNPSTLYASGFNGTDILFKTTDGGANWSGSSTGLPFTLINNLAIDPVTPTTLYAATVGSAVFKSTNGGANWAQSNTGLTNLTVNAVAVDRNNPSSVYAGTSILNDAFAIRLNPTGSTPEYFLNFGGNENDEARGVALDTDGNAYIVGTTNSPNFPVASAYQPTLGGAADAFVVKLNAAGNSFVYSSYLGGSGSDQGRAIAVRSGSAYVTGLTSSSNFPLANPLKSVLAQFDTDAFVTKLNASGSALDFSTYLGGSSTDQGLGIAVDSNGGVYVTGSTFSSDFPTQSAPQPGFNGGTDAFVTKLNSAGTSIAYSTYLGGTSNDQGNGVAVDSAGNAYVVGTTSSTDFPTVNPFQSTLKGTDAFVAKIGVQADVSISKSDSRDPVMVNNPLTYTLKVNNAGPSPVTGVTVFDTLPSGLMFGSATSTLGSCSFNNGTVTCDVGNMPAAGAVTITIAVTPTATGTINNTATVTANEPDNNTANNSATETTKVSASPSVNGRVTDNVGTAVSGVLMTLSGAQSATTLTDSTGFYQFAELPAGGTYVVTPTKSNLSIDPQSQTFNALGADQTANFVASTCTYSIAPTIQSFGAAGGSGSVNVTSLHDCVWTAVSSTNWITVTSGGLGAGNGTVNFTVSATTAPRAGHITIAGKNFAIYQEFNSCGAPAFSVANYNLPDNPTVIRVADLNGDARPDLALVTNGLSGGGIEASVLLNDGAGGFSASSFDTGLGVPQGFVLSDFNGDGKPDIAMTSYNFSSVRIFLNNGSGGFGQSHVDIPFTSQGQSPLTRDLFAADLNHDGKADLVVSTPGTNSLQVLLGNGSGGFTQLAQVNLPTNFGLLATADVNNDGAPDLILGGSGAAGTLAVMLGDGSGGFATAIVSSGSDVTSQVATGDFDNDGKLDIAIAGGTITSPPTVSPAIVIMSGDGTGHFTKTSSVVVNQIAGLTVADFNNDAKSDVAFTAGDTHVTLLLGDGAGALGSPIQVDTPGQSPGNQRIVAFDSNGDSRPDLAVANYTVGAFVLRNTCAAAPSISGRITDSRNTRGLAGVPIALSGAQNGTTQTDGGGNYFFGNLTAGANYVVTPSKDNFRFNPANANINNLAGNRTADFVGTPITLQFSTQDYVVDENAGSIKIDVRRLGDLSGVTTVDYATVDGTASARTDYTAAFGTLRFDPGDSLKSFTVLITNDNLVEGFESLTLLLSNPTGAIFNSSPMEGPPNTSLVEIRDDDFGSPTSNPLDDAQFFVRQHYYDFLSRLPDPSGFNFWTGQINQCGLDSTCLRNKRIDVSNAFFYELEYQQTGSYVYRLYRAAFGNSQPFPNPIPDPAHPGEEKKVLAYQVFAIDRARVVGGASLSQAQLDLANAFVLRPDFVAKYAATLDGPGFVDTILATINNDISVDLTSQRTALIALFNSGGRGAVLYRLADDNAQTNPINNRAFIDAEYNRAFVATQYFGYLRRDADMGGFLFWLGQVNSAPLRDVPKQHAMVCSFITSAEYQLRFSSLVTHFNSECQ